MTPDWAERHGPGDPRDSESIVLRTPGDTEASRARPHHYDYAHRLLPALVFDDPARFLELAALPTASARLAESWDAVGERLRAEENAEPVPADGLSLTLRSLNGTSLALVRFPTVERTREVFFAAVIPDTDAEAGGRYVLLERTAGSRTNTPDGALCECYPDGSRRNHDRLVVATEHAFLVAVADLLKLEQRRRAAGLVTATTPRWNPSDTASFGLWNGYCVCRRAYCRFLFNELPRLLDDNFDRWADDVSRTGTIPKLVALWPDATGLAPKEVPDHAFRSEWIEAGPLTGILLTMPEPLGPPEPRFVFMQFERDWEEGAGTRRLYLMESSVGAFGLPFVCSILRSAGPDPETSHALHGLAPGDTKQDFIAAIQSHHSGRRLERGGEDVVKIHMLHWGMIEKDLENARDAIRRDGS